MQNQNGINFDIDDIITDLNGKADVDLTNVNNTGTSKSASWTMPSGIRIELSPPASSSSGGTALANTELFTAPCNGYFNVGATTNNSAGVWWTFTDGAAVSNRTVGQYNYHANCSIPIKKGDKAYLRGMYVSVINAVLFVPCVGSEAEVANL